MAGEGARRLQRQVVIQPRTGIGEQRLEHPAHGEHGRSRVDPGAIGHQLAHLAAGCVGPFEQQHVLALPRQVNRGGQARHAGPDDDGTAATHFPLDAAVNLH